MDIKNKAQFIEYFSKGIKDIDQLKIGVEHERFLFEGQNRKRISYPTLKKLFENLKSDGWETSIRKRKYDWYAKRQSTNYYRTRTSM
jgi:glutamate--cysteine ligase